MRKKCVDYIEERQKILGDIPKIDISDRLEKLKNFYREKDIIIKFAPDYPDNPHLNAHITRSKKKVVIFSSEWAFQLILKNCIEAEMGFIYTLGHELTHKEIDIFPLKYPHCCKFIAWVNEMHADYGSSIKVFNGDTQKTVKAMNFVGSFNNYDIEDFSHPSWVRRLYYIQKYPLWGEDLIRRIARDTKCFNEGIIRKIINHYTITKI